ncbi:MAG: hypothetical protein P1U68_05580 [Verrucomicrobiales bacterium]|nr:hypothetical protein [Verrucomicrobiales bacterium]
MKIAILTGIILSFTIEASHAQAISLSRPLPKSVEHSSSGPWGNLDFYEIKLSSPLSYLSQLAIPSEQTEWNFTQESRAEIVAEMEEAGFSAEEISYLVSEGSLVTVGESLKLFPTSEMISEIPGDLKSRFYSFLGRNPANRFHHRPAYINTTNLTRYFHHSNLPVETLQHIAKLAYKTPSGYGFFLSDIPSLLKQTSNSEEERLLMNAILRVPALMVRINLSEMDSIDELANYWSAGHQNKQVLSLFESIYRNPSVDRLDIGHLLPPIARQNLNRYPEQPDGLNGRYPDWFWTCYNFSRFSPVDVYADTDQSRALMEKAFAPVKAPYTFGDMLLFNSRGRVIHGCIYIADDIVYTKNGPGLLSPFILMRLQDVIAYHDLVGDVTLSQYRRTRQRGALPPAAVAPTPSN